MGLGCGDRLRVTLRGSGSDPRIWAGVLGALREIVIMGVGLGFWGGRDTVELGLGSLGGWGKVGKAKMTPGFGIRDPRHVRGCPG